MKTALILGLLVSLLGLCHALKCHTCVASNEDECNRQGVATCPQYADACSTITGPNTVMKSCSYKSFCDKAHGGTTGAKMECCYGDDCNGPHKGHSQGQGQGHGHGHGHGHGSHHSNGVGAVDSSPVLLMMTALLLRVTCGQV